MIDAMLAWCGDPRLALVLSVSDFIIAAAYVSIPAAIVAYLRKRPDIETRWLFWLFVAFIGGCGATHFIHGAARLDGWWVQLAAPIHIFTALVSITTAGALWPLLPILAKIPSPAMLLRMVEERDLAVDELGSHRELLVRELNHRVRNNLSIAVGALSLQSRAARNPEVRAALETALGRIRAIAAVHDKIYGNGRDPGTVQADSYVAGLCAALSEQLGVAVLCDVDEIELLIDEAVPIAQVVNELVTNAAKYGMPPVIVVLRAEPEGWTLTVSDEGPGPNGAGRTGSLGLKMTRRLALQLGGELEIDGATFRIRGQRHKRFEEVA